MRARSSPARWREAAAAVRLPPVREERGRKKETAA
jgi:hypothetical protein